MKVTNPNMYWIGSLQNIGKNYADLYIDKDEQKLYLLIRLPDTSEDHHYALISVTPEQIKEYMDGEKNIAEVFSNHPYKLATIQDHKIGLEDKEQLSTPGMFIYNQPFDTGVSTNRSNINLVLKRLKKGRTI